MVVAIGGQIGEAEKEIVAVNDMEWVDAIELRCDLLECDPSDRSDRVRHLRSLTGKKVILTLRSREEGGKWGGREEERIAVLCDLLSFSPDYVDVESHVDAEVLVHIRKRAPGVKIIRSFHDPEKTPEDLEAVLCNLEKVVADIYKISTLSRSTIDSLRMLLFIEKACTAGKKVAGMCMGQHGQVTRILAPVVGSAMTYASFSKERETAPFQVTVDELEGIYRFSRLTRSTVVCALIGDPVDKSFGHLAHNALFERFGTDAVYVRMRVLPDEVSDFFRLIGALPFRGCSVTMPLKEHVRPYLNEVERDASEIGAINTIAIRDRNGTCVRVGSNTDGMGALDAVEAVEKVRGKKVIVAGAGGTARAVVFETVKRGGEVLIINRTYEKGKLLADRFGCKAISLATWHKEKVPFDIFMNTTSVGMSSLSSGAPVEEEELIEGMVVFDAVMNPKETELLKRAERRGCGIVYGYEMFARQALKQFEAWFGGITDFEVASAIEVLYRSISRMIGRKT
ncbi:MAG: shikimate dehydrogenase [Simkaniaceae bacterium]|nr:shikimate dehydrogenase [Simkaniaceae bacterium]